MGTFGMLTTTVLKVIFPKGPRLFPKRYYCAKNDDDTKKETLPTKRVLKDQTHTLTAEDEDDASFDPSERKQEANTQGTMSKECNILAGKKVPIASSTGLNLFLEIGKDQPPPPMWDIDLDKKIKRIKLPIVPPAKEPELPMDEPPSSPPDRLVRREQGEVVAGFLPQEWVDFFVPKTGATGFYTFLVTVSTTLVSKELYVLEHNFYNGLSVMILLWGTVKYVGPHVARYTDREIEAYERSWQQTRDDQKDELVRQIDEENFLQFQSDGQLTLIEAKRENVALQLEEEFRRRQMVVYKEVKLRLDYHLAVQRVRQKYQQLNMVDYVFREVTKSITPDMQDKLIYYSIDKLAEEINREDSGKK